MDPNNSPELLNLLFKHIFQKNDPKTNKSHNWFFPIFTHWSPLSVAIWFWWRLSCPRVQTIVGYFVSAGIGESRLSWILPLLPASPQQHTFNRMIPESLPQRAVRNVAPMGELGENNLCDCWLGTALLGLYLAPRAGRTTCLLGPKQLFWSILV